MTTAVRSAKTIRFVTLSACMIASVISATRNDAQVFTETATITPPWTPDLKSRIEAVEFTELFDLRTAHRLKLGVSRAVELEVEHASVWYRRARFVGANGFGAREVLGGVTDPRFQIKYAPLRTDRTDDALRAALFAEIQVPVGRDSQRANGVRIPRRLQISSGGWTFGAGGAVTWIRDRTWISLATRFRHPTRHDGFRVGETLAVDAAYRFRLLPTTIDLDVRQLEVRPVVELQYRRAFRSRARRAVDDDATRVWGVAGIQLFPLPNLQLEAAVRVPVWQRSDRTIGRARWGALGSVRVWF